MTAIYGGHSFTDQEIALISYPNNNIFKDGPAVLLGAFARARRLSAGGMTPEQRIEAALAQGSVFHPESYRKEFVTGASVAWSRVPWTLGCCARWNEESRKAHYQNLVAVHGPPHRAGRRARLLCRLLDGGRAAVLASTPSPVCTSARWRPDHDHASQVSRRRPAGRPRRHPGRRPGASRRRHRRRHHARRQAGDRRAGLQVGLRRLPHAGRQGRTGAGTIPGPGQQSQAGRRGLSDRRSSPAARAACRASPAR
jgi:hypothetical protein